MAFLQERFGADLKLLGNLEFQNDRARGSDLFYGTRPETRQVDLQTLAGNENLEQALLLRFLTPMGELALLGHPDYGSRLSELIGELNNDTNRNRAKMYVLQALALEPRIKKVLRLTVTPNLARRDQIDISMTLSVIDSDTPLNLVFPFFLQGGGKP
ncbi:MAG TPA: GPW/gp25 family protein [Terriglobia bacterium]|nr:GPW/gp25 family protein [Terriglobia bacterium]